MHMGNLNVATNETRLDTDFKRAIIFLRKCLSRETAKYNIALVYIIHDLDNKLQQK